LEIDLESLSRFVDATGPLAIVDLETTGLSEDPAAEILEFGAVLVEPGARSITTVESLVRPQRSLPLTISRLTGLTDADVTGAPTIDEISKQIELVLDGRTLIAHNADFERSFLIRFVSTALSETCYLDTQDFLAISHPDSADLRLEAFTRAMLHREERHRALSDALDTVRVMSAAAVGARAGERRYAVARSALESYAPESPWLPLFCAGAQLAAEKPYSQYAAILPTSEKPVPFDEDAIVAVLSDVDRGRRYFPNYRVREQQLELARHFVRNLDTGGRLLLEGGTGIGKSLAYLAAAIPFVMERAAGGVRDPVVISTRTRLLQDQLLTKDIPAAAAMFGCPDLKALSIKGRANYICARRAAVVLAEGREPQVFATDRLAYAALAACAGIRRQGEVGTLPAGLHYRFRPLRDLVRRSVAARAEQCTREQCAMERDCPFGQRRAALAKAHLVVANHDLLLRWPPDYPTFGDAIIDEAQELAGVVDEVDALEVKPLEVLEEIDGLFGRPSDGRRGAGLLGRSSVREMEGDVRARRRGIQQDLVALGRCLADRASEFGEVQLPAYPDRVFPQAAELAQMAAERLVAAADAADRLAKSRGLEEDDRLAIERITAELRTAAGALRGAFSGSDGDAVAAFEQLEPPFDRWRLVVRAVSPADSFHQRFAERLETLACVSASLFVSNDPFAALGELELERHGEPPVTRVSVESPF
ncbi:MAG: exonuclease domain-containing protein, partial [Myxococcota bacterium]